MFVIDDYASGTNLSSLRDKIRSSAKTVWSLVAGTRSEGTLSEEGQAFRYEIITGAVMDSPSTLLLICPGHDLAVVGMVSHVRLKTTDRWRLFLTGVDLTGHNPKPLDVQIIRDLVDAILGKEAREISKPHPDGRRCFEVHESHDLSSPVP